LGVAFLGAILFWSGNNQAKFAGVLLTAASVGGMTAIKGVDLLKLKFKVSLDPELTITTGRPMQYLALPSIGPFKEGEDSVMDDTLAERSLEASLVSANRLLEDRRTAFVFIVGGADKRQLLQRPRDTYGSNEGLANARAVWISSRLDNPHSVPILTWGGGAKEASRTPTREQLARARHVKVYVARLGDDRKGVRSALAPPVRPR
jgi:hypothetical protein